MKLPLPVAVRRRRPGSPPDRPNGTKAGSSVRTAVGSPEPSEGFKPRGVDRPRMDGSLEGMMLGEDELLAPAVVIATIALIAVFVLGLLYQVVGLVV
jgi:hypothetical protein